MTQNLKFKPKWQEAISKVKKIGWNMTPDSKASYCKAIWSAVTFIGKNHNNSLHGEQHLLQLHSSALQAHITHFPPCPFSPVSSIYLHLGWIIPWRGPSLSTDDTRSLDRALFGYLDSRWEYAPEKYQPVTSIISRRFRNSFDANSPIIICISQFPNDFFFRCSWN